MKIGIGLGLTYRLAVGGGGDTTAPSVTLDSASDTEADFTSNEAGTAYWLINTDGALLSGPTIEAGGGSLSGSFAAASGANSFTLWCASLATGTYYLHLTVKDAAGNHSTDQVLSFAHTYLGIQYVGAKAVSASGTATNFAVDLTTLTGGIDTAARPNDLVVVYTAIAAGLSLTTGIDTSVSTGWTMERNEYGNDLRDVRLRNAYKLMGSTPDSSVTCLAGGNGGYSSMAIAMAFRGVHLTTPLDVVSTGASAINGTAINPAAITPSTSGALIIAGGANTGTGTPTDITGAPTGFTNLTIVTKNSTSIDGNLAVATQSGWTSGAVDPDAFTGATLTADDASATITMALKPAA